MDTVSPEQRTSQIICRHVDARELTPDEQLSSSELDIFDQIIERARRIPGDDLARESIVDAIRQAAAIGSKEFLELARWVEEASENQVLTLRDVVGRLLPDVDYYVTDILRNKGYITMIAKRKQGKSLLAMLLALSLSAGKDWLTMRVKPEGVTVLYLNYEISHEKFMGRIQDMSEAMGIPLNDNFMFQSVSKIALDTAQGKNHLAKIIESCPRKPQVIILDPRYGFMDGDENQTQDMTAFIDSLKQLENMPGGMAFVVVAHAGKSEGKGARGNSVFEDGAETLMTLHGGTHTPNTKDLEMTGRDIEETKLVLELRYPVFVVKDAARTDTPKVDRAKVFILEFLQTHPDGILRVDIDRACRSQVWSTNVVHRALDKLRAEDLIAVEPAVGIGGNHKRVSNCLH